MFTPLRDFPLKTFEGYTLAVFRQGRTNIAAKILRKPVLHVLPFAGKAGLFLPAAYPLPTEEMIRREWERQGAPPVQLPGAREFVLLGRVFSAEVIPFAGYDDFWLEGDRATLLCKRAFKPQRFEAQLETLRRETLLQRAHALLARWDAQLPRQPASIRIAPLRPRILGNCSRDGEIRLNRSLADYSEPVLEEVLAHEVVHLTHFNHSPAFWNALTDLLPDWLSRTLVHYLQ